MSHPSSQQLKRALEITAQIERLELELNAILGFSGKAASTAVIASAGKKKKHGMSAAGRAAIAAAQRARWAALKAKGPGKKKWKMSAAARAKIAAAQRKRWAAQKAA